MAGVHNWLGQGVNTGEQIDLLSRIVTCPAPISPPLNPQQK